MMSFRLQFGSNSICVIKLSVDHGPDRTGLIAERLLSAREIVDAQSSMCESGIPTLRDPAPRLVGPSMLQAVESGLQLQLVD